MSEKRTKFAEISLKTWAKSGRKTVKIEVFPSDQWWDGKDGYFRLRVDGYWSDPERYPYRSADAVASYVAQRLRLVLRNSSPVRPLRRKVESLQRAFMDVGPDDHLLGIPLHSVEVRIVSEDSVIGEDGRQYVVVNSVATGTVLVAIDDLRFYDKEEDR